jgi:hypothetical protein
MLHHRQSPCLRWFVAPEHHALRMAFTAVQAATFPLQLLSVYLRGSKTQVIVW